MVELHGHLAATFGHRAKCGGVTKHFRKGHFCIDGFEHALVFSAFDLAAFGSEVAVVEISCFACYIKCWLWLK